MLRIIVKRVLFFMLWSFSAFGQHYYVLTHRVDPAGFFSVFHTVLGALDFMETSSDCCGLGIDFEDKGFYYDKERGKNWWEYYFERVDLGKKTDIVNKFAHYKKVIFSLGAEKVMSRERGNELIKKYIVLKSHIKNKIDDFYEKHFRGAYVIGVHYRGTDKCLEADIVPYKTVYERLQPLIKGHEDSYKIFVATDDYYFLTYMNVQFPGHILVIDALRSDAGTAVHFTEKNLNYKKGEDAVIDCVLLSKCDLLLKMSSNLSNCSIKFNSTMPVIDLNKGW